MMRFLTIIITSLLLCSCATNNNMGFGFNFTNQTIFHHHIEQNVNPESHGTVSVLYKSSYIVYTGEYAKLKDSLLREPTLLEGQALANAAPKGGQILISIGRSSIEAANTKHFEFIILQDGIEIYRVNGNDRIPNVPSSRNGDWMNYKAVTLTQPFENNLKVYVIDKVNGGRDEFIITKPNNAPYSQPDA